MNAMKKSAYLLGHHEISKFGGLSNDWSIKFFSWFISSESYLFYFLLSSISLQTWFKSDWSSLKTLLIITAITWFRNRFNSWNLHRSYKIVTPGLTKLFFKGHSLVDSLIQRFPQIIFRKSWVFISLIKKKSIVVDDKVIIE